VVAILSASNNPKRY